MSSLHADVGIVPADVRDTGGAIRQQQQQELGQDEVQPPRKRQEENISSRVDLWVQSDFYAGNDMTNTWRSIKEVAGGKKVMDPRQ